MHVSQHLDHDTAMSAVRNLNGQEIGGRPLRIDLADSDPFLEGKTTVRGELLDGGETRAQWRERQHEREGSRRPTDPASFLSQLPHGTPLPPGVSAMDHISKVLAGIQPAQMFDILAQMKVHSRVSCASTLSHGSRSRRHSSLITLTRLVPCLLHIQNWAMRCSKHCS